MRPPRPTVVLCGPVAAGKSTIAGRLVETTDLHHLSAEVSRQSSLMDDRRRSDLKLLRELGCDGRPVLVESSTLPGLLPVNNSALIIRMVASPPVRAHRLRVRIPRMSYAARYNLLEVTDAMTCRQARSAWGIDIADDRANRWGADLVIGCPEVDGCTDEPACLDIVVMLLAAAYAVYESYLDSATDGRDAVAVFRDLCRTYFEHVRRCTPALLNPVTQLTPDAWRDRMANELERRAVL